MCKEGEESLKQLQQGKNENFRLKNVVINKDSQEYAQDKTTRKCRVNAIYGWEETHVHHSWVYATAKI